MVYCVLWSRSDVRFFGCSVVSVPSGPCKTQQLSTHLLITQFAKRLVAYPRHRGLYWFLQTRVFCIVCTGDSTAQTKSTPPSLIMSPAALLNQTCATPIVRAQTHAGMLGRADMSCWLWNKWLPIPKITGSHIQRKKLQMPTKKLMWLFGFWIVHLQQFKRCGKENFRKWDSPPYPTLVIFHVEFADHIALGYSW